MSFGAVRRQIALPNQPMADQFIALATLLTDVRRTMALCGAASVDDLTPDLVVAPPAVSR